MLYCNNCSIFDHSSLRGNQLEIVKSYLQIQEYFESTVLFVSLNTNNTTRYHNFGPLIASCIDGKGTTCGILSRALEYIRCKILKFNLILTSRDSITEITALIRTEFYRVLSQFVSSVLNNQMVKSTNVICLLLLKSYSCAI